MKLLLFSDIHNDGAALSRLMDIEADYYFAAGDLVNYSHGLDRMGEIMKRRAGKVYVIPGNNESERDVAELCDEYGLINFHGQTMIVNGWHIGGLGYSNPTPFGTPGEYTEAELAHRLTPFAGLDPLIMVCHCPPKNTKLDQGSSGRHHGSTAIADFIARAQPRHFFCGHVHESAGVVEKIGKTTGVNVGKEGYLLEL